MVFDDPKGFLLWNMQKFRMELLKSLSSLQSFGLLNFKKYRLQFSFRKVSLVHGINNFLRVMAFISLSLFITYVDMFQKYMQES